MTEIQKVEETCNMIRKYVPNYKIKQKSDSIFMRVIGWFFSKIGNPDFMHEFWTTIGSTTYRPTCTDQDAASNEYSVLMHEGNHSIQAKKYNLFLWAVSYLFPVWLGLILPIIFLLGGHWLLAIIALGFIAPIPSPFRAWYEYDSYKVSICADFWSDNGSSSDNQYMNSFIQWLSGPAYYYTWPFTVMLTNAFSKHIKHLRENTLVMTDYLNDCKQLCEKYRIGGV